MVTRANDIRAPTTTPRRPTLSKLLTKLLGRRGLAPTLQLLPLASSKTSTLSSSPTATTPTSATTATPTAASTAATKAPTPATTPTAATTSTASTTSTIAPTTTPAATATNPATLSTRDGQVRSNGQLQHCTVPVQSCAIRSERIWPTVSGCEWLSEQQRHE
ncbi:unnamed protein product [Closterium sp. NIES-54]